MTTSKESPQISALLGGGAPAPSAISAVPVNSAQGATPQQSKQSAKKGSRRGKIEDGRGDCSAVAETEKVNYTLPKDIVQNIRTLAWYQRKEIKQVVEEALRAYLSGAAAGDLVKAVKERGRG